MRKKILSVVILIVVLVLFLSPVFNVQLINSAKADSFWCEVMMCDCHVSYSYVGGSLWLGVLTDHCVPYRRIGSCKPYC